MIKAGFRKEWLQFTRTFRLGGVLLGILSFALAEPLLLWGMNALVGLAGDYGETVELGTLLGMGNAGLAEFSFCSSMTEFCTTSTLVVMLVLMSPCGGEQKKRATMIPLCSGIGAFEYLVPKYVIYPVTVFLTGFVGSCISGALSNALFPGDDVGVGMILLGALLCAVYLTFILVVYMSIGICTSRPGIVTAMMYVGVIIVQMILSGLDLTDYNPFTLRTLVSGTMFSEDFVLADNVANIIVAVVLSVVIGVMMFILALTVLKAKRINNQEDKPEF